MTYRPERLAQSMAVITVLSGTIMLSSYSYADDSVVDEINITVPVSCTLEGTGMTSHNAIINNGVYTPNIGTTTITTYCNDNNGFAIYAAGYTGEVVGETNSNKLVGVNNSTQTIATGTATSAGNPDVSNWAMKLTAVSSPTPTYPIIISGSTNDSLKQQGDPDFSNYTLVPNEYTKVAYRTAATDIGQSAEGASLTTTYAAYISRTQPADTYAGKVIYTLVHPSQVDKNSLKDAITVIFDGDGLSFPNGNNTNTVKYAKNCQSLGEGYVSNTPTTLKTSNLNNDGTNNGSYTNGEYIHQNIAINDADKMLVELKYNVTGNTISAVVIDEYWDGNNENWNSDWEENAVFSEENISGKKVYLIDNNTITIHAESWDWPSLNHEYGFYFKVYPVYNVEKPNTTYQQIFSENCTISPISGAYQETTVWNDRWIGNINNEPVDFTNESTLTSFLSSDENSSLKGTTINLKAVNLTTIPSMQNVSEWGTSLAANDTMAAKDERDNKIYIIAKYADGNIWMAQNLDLDIDANTTYTNEDTDIGYNSSTGEYNTASWTPVRSTYAPTATQTHEWCNGGVSTGGTCSKNNTPESYNPGNLYWNNEVSNTSDWYAYENSGYDESLYPFRNYVSNNGFLYRHIGNYYNWSAAIAMNDTSSLIANGITAEQSICPSGWTLPKASSNSNENNFKTLWDQYGFTETPINGTNAMTKKPLYYSPSGTFYGRFARVGVGGNFNSPVLSFVYQGYQKVQASFDIGGLPNISPYVYSEGMVGMSIRCIAR